MNVWRPLVPCTWLAVPDVLMRLPHATLSLDPFEGLAGHRNLSEMAAVVGGWDSKWYESEHTSGRTGIC